MATQIKTLAANVATTVLITDTGKQYARIISGELDGNQPASIPSPATYYGKIKYNEDVSYEMDDADYLEDTGNVRYWGVESVRR